MTERTEGSPEADSAWLQIPDGYVRERGVLFGALGPSSATPFDPTVHLTTSQVGYIATHFTNLNSVICTPERHFTQFPSY